MKVKLGQVTATLLLSSSLLLTASPVFADEAPSSIAQTVAAPSLYALTDSLQVQVKGVLSENNSDGVALGATIRITNTSDKIVRIPDHELRVTTNEGTVYTLIPSSTNAHGIQPQSGVDLTYLKTVDRQTAVHITQLSLVDVNYDVYPKLETVLTSIPVESLAWDGREASSGNQQSAAWGGTFTIPSMESPIKYTPTQFLKSYTKQGTSYLIQLLAENPSDHTEKIPVFGIDGKADNQIFHGKRVEQTISLEPGEKKYIHYIVDTGMDVTLSSMNVLTTETFVQSAGGTAVAVQLGFGKLNIALPALGAPASSGGYQYGNAISIDPVSKLVNRNLNVSLVELHESLNDEDGTKTVLAKLKLDNKGDRPLPIPSLQTELWTKDGYSYSGNRQQMSQSRIESGTSSIVSYAFTLPKSESEEQFTLKLLDDQSAAPYSSPVAAIGVTLQGNDGNSKISLYPYTLNMNHVTAYPVISPTATNSLAYSYKMILDVDLQRDDQVVVDNSFSKLKIELYDPNGKSLGAKYFPFTGPNRITNGNQELSFDNLRMDQANSRVTIKIYESITTATGEANRLLYTVDQK